MSNEDDKEGRATTIARLNRKETFKLVGILRSPEFDMSNFDGRSLISFLYNEHGLNVSLETLRRICEDAEIEWTAKGGNKGAKDTREMSILRERIDKLEAEMRGLKHLEARFRRIESFIRMDDEGQTEMALNKNENGSE